MTTYVWAISGYVFAIAFATCCCTAVAKPSGCKARNRAMHALLLLIIIFVLFYIACELQVKMYINSTCIQCIYSRFTWYTTICMAMNQLSLDNVYKSMHWLMISNKMTLGALKASPQPGDDACCTCVRRPLCVGSHGFCHGGCGSKG